MDELRHQIETVVAECCVQLFSHYGVTIEPVPSYPDADFAFCATIGFTGRHMRGSLLLASSPEPLTIAGDDAPTVRDWIAELANQMIGRIKTRLIALGAPIYYSTPIIIRGQHLARLGDQPTPQLFLANGGVVSVWFDVDVGAELVLADEPAVGASVREGEALLF